MSIIEKIRTKFEALIPFMDERLRRLWAGSEAVALGREGIKTVAFATGLSTKTIRREIQELSLDAFTLHFKILKRLMEKEQNR